MNTEAEEIKRLANRSRGDMYADMFDASCEEKKWLVWENSQLECQLINANRTIEQLLKDQA